MRIYLAGPEVFLANPLAIAQQKKRICARYGLQGIFPFDAALDLNAIADLRERGLAISRANEELLASCSAIIANLTPYRGPSADAGTVFELGMACGLGLKVMGYSNVTEDFQRRTLALLGERATYDQTQEGYRDDRQMAVEHFGLNDNLMIDGAIALRGGQFFTQQVEPDRRYTDLTAFEHCVTALKKHQSKDLQ